MTLSDTIAYLHEVVDQAPTKPNKYAVSAHVSWRTILNLRILLAIHEGDNQAVAHWKQQKSEWLKTFQPKEGEGK